MYYPNVDYTNSLIDINKIYVNRMTKIFGEEYTNNLKKYNEQNLNTAKTENGKEV